MQKQIITFEDLLLPNSPTPPPRFPRLFILVIIGDLDLNPDGISIYSNQLYAEIFLHIWVIIIDEIYIRECSYYKRFIDKLSNWNFTPGKS